LSGAFRPAQGGPGFELLTEEDEVLRKRDFAAGLTAATAVVVVPGLARAQVQDHRSEANDQVVAADSILAGATLQLTVVGMACPVCAHGLEKRLIGLSGVDSLTVRARDGLVQIREKAGHRMTDAELRRSVESAGFSLRDARRLGS
jgi:mercuric ion binding protein